MLSATVSVIDAELGVIHVPRNHTVPTIGANRQNPTQPSLCCEMFHRGSCQAGIRCTNVHVMSEYLDALRERRPVELCCPLHEDNIDWNKLANCGQLFICGTAAGQRIEIPIEQISPTMYSERLLQARSNTYYVPSSKLCIEFQTAECPRGRRCVNIHLCRPLWVALVEKYLWLRPANMPALSTPTPAVKKQVTTTRDTMMLPPKAQPLQEEEDTFDVSNLMNSLYRLFPPGAADADLEAMFHQRFGKKQQEDSLSSGNDTLGPEALNPSEDPIVSAGSLPQPKAPHSGVIDYMPILKALEGFTPAMTPKTIPDPPKPVIKPKPQSLPVPQPQPQPRPLPEQKEKDVPAHMRYLQQLVEWHSQGLLTKEEFAQAKEKLFW